MKVKKNQIFNLMDTNGRRKDVINALSGYIEILHDISENKKLKWASMPESYAQFEFYRQALLRFPDIFKEHKYYDAFLEKAQRNKSAVRAIQTLDTKPFISGDQQFNDILELFDKGIEDRARHYTGTLVKLGFADKNRNIAENGRLLIAPELIEKDKLEQIIPADSVNILYLRQMMKLRIFDENGKKYVSPFCLAIFLLLKYNRISEDIFFEIIQNAVPYFKGQYPAYYQSEKLDDFINPAIGDIEIPNELCQFDMLDRKSFLKIFKNRKSGKTADIYIRFYGLLFDFYVKQTDTELNHLITYYENNKYVLNKAFGKGRSFLKYNNKTSSAASFISDNKELFCKEMNIILYKMFSESKKADGVKEYSDTTKRIFKATGVISFNNGYAELVNKDLFECIIDIGKLRSLMAGNMENELNPYFDDYEDYEEDVTSYFCKTHSLCEIFDYSTKDVSEIIVNIKNVFGADKDSDLKEKISSRRNKEFESFILRKYPVKEVQRILALFSDRKNDRIIKETVSPDASVPTIYEYMVGIAWYYFSDRKADLLSGLNLTMSADFEPLVHAGGGQGDIIFNEERRIIMLEATLMNSASQKRGEWEPVLRHSVNLKTEAESNPEDSKKTVITFFIADEFDINTVNIWKAVSCVPLQSSVNKNLYTENVTIMPISNNELSILTEKNKDYDRIIDTVKDLFDKDKQQFDMGWRGKFIRMLDL